MMDEKLGEMLEEMKVNQLALAIPKAEELAKT